MFLYKLKCNCSKRGSISESTRKVLGTKFIVSKGLDVVYDVHFDVKNRSGGILKQENFTSI